MGVGRGKVRGRAPRSTGFPSCTIFPPAAKRRHCPFPRPCSPALPRDGGLYVPETYPQLEARRDRAASPALPMPRSRTRVIAPFLDADARGGRVRGDGRGRLCDASGIRPSLRWSRSTTISSCSSCSTVRRSPSRMWRCNCSAGSWIMCSRRAASARRSSARPRATPARPRSRRSAASSRSTCSFSIRTAASPRCSAGR